MHNFEKNCKLGKQLNIEQHYNYHNDSFYSIRRDLKKLHRGWGKHRIEDEIHTTYCPRLGKVVQYQKGKPKLKER